MKREIEDYIMDAINAMTKSMEFIDGMEYEDFIKDDKTIFAVIRAIEIIGEAFKNQKFLNTRKSPIFDGC